jgi:hypothetical protein
MKRCIRKKLEKEKIYLYHNRKMLKKQILKGQVRETQTGEQEYWKGDPTSLSFSR